MIVRELPSTLKLFFVMQGSVVPKIIGRIIGIALLSVVVMLLDQYVVTLPHKRTDEQAVPALIDSAKLPVILVAVSAGTL